MLVTLDIFSGRRNPRWTLDESDASRLDALHHGLAASEAPPSEVPGLGYRGFVYELDGAVWRALRGQVAGPTEVLVDPSRSVERLLADLMPAEYMALRPIILGSA
jgi:hypothetical protein